jgi:hypothetical protein
MKKFILFVFFGISMIINTSAQSKLDTIFVAKTKLDAYQKNHLYVSGGLGVPDLTEFYINTFSGGEVSETYYSIGIVHAKLEYALNDEISIGFVANYNTMAGLTKYNNIEHEFELRSLSISLRSNYHFYYNQKWDFFCGAGIGYKHFTFDVNDNRQVTILYSLKPASVPVSAEATFGMRYFPTKTIGFFTELGIAKSILQFGVSARL